MQCLLKTAMQSTPTASMRANSGHRPPVPPDQQHLIPKPTDDPIPEPTPDPDIDNPSPNARTGQSG